MLRRILNDFAANPAIIVLVDIEAGGGQVVALETRWLKIEPPLVPDFTLVCQNEHRLFTSHNQV